VNIVAILKMVPDVVEELEVAEDGKSLDLEYLRLMVNERDEHALEQALLLKEHLGGTVTVVGLDGPEVDDVFFTALAKGADRAVKVTDVEEGLTTRGVASILAEALPAIPDLLPADLILTGCQAIDDLDAQTAALLAQRLGLPYLGVVSQVQVDTSAGVATVAKEYPGGVRGEFEIALPAVLGIQAAEKPPRYVPVAKVRAAMKEREVETVPASAGPAPALVEILEMTKPEAAGQAEMIEGTPEDIAAKLCEILAERGLL
jgi:electron transfer flavoprotein beta subunit